VDNASKAPDSVSAVRWDRLFDDLEARLESEEDAARRAELGDLVRAERSALTLLDRLRGHRGAVLTWHLSGAGAVSAQLRDLGAGWVLLLVAHPDLSVPEPGRELLVPLAAVQAVSGLARSAAVAGELERRMGMGVVLRRLARDRTTVALRLVRPESAGPELSASVLTGTIDRVGADHLDLALHPRDVPRRPSAVTDVLTVALGSLLWLEAVE
jgi:hypothetical protein